MRSRPRKLLFVVGAVLVFYSFLLWLNPSWLTLRPLTTLTHSENFIYRGPEAEDKAVIMAKTHRDSIDWVTQELPDWQQAIYYMDRPEEGILHPPQNKGRESMAYLTFIIDHYENLPSVMVFLHPHLDNFDKTWHVDSPNHNNLESIRSLRLEYVLEHGYANMRCQHDPGCPAEVQPHSNDPSRPVEYAMREAWPSLFGGSLADVPQVIAQPCCAQFAVSRTQVLKRDRTEYLRYRQWLLDTTLSDQINGRIMEYLWHIVFGKDPVYCPDRRQCYCEQFGRC